QGTAAIPWRGSSARSASGSGSGVRSASAPPACSRRAVPRSERCWRSWAANASRSSPPYPRSGRSSPAFWRIARPRACWTRCGRRAKETQDLVFGPWLRLGDVLREDEHGFFHYVGRVDDLFKVDAQWVSPVQVEAVLLDHDAVAEAAVVGIPDARGLTRPHVFVVLAPRALGASGLAHELRRHVTRRLSAHAAPAAV